MSTSAGSWKAGGRDRAVTPRYSFNTWNHSATWGLEPTLPAQIAAAVAAGYDFVGLDVPSLLAHEAGGLAPETIRECLDAAGIACFELVPLSISGDPAATEESLDRVVRLAPILGARQVLTVIRGPVAPDTVFIVRRCVEALATRGVAVAIEFLPTTEVDSIDAVDRLLDEVDHPGARVMVDSWHFFVGPSSWSSLDRLAVDRLGFVQFSDALSSISDDTADEYRHRRALPGEGMHDLQAFSRHILERWPDIVVSVEVLSSAWRSRPVDEFAEATYRSTAPFWGPADGGAVHRDGAG